MNYLSRIQTHSRQALLSAISLFVLCLFSPSISLASTSAGQLNIPILYVIVIAAGVVIGIVLLMISIVLILKCLSRDAPENDVKLCRNIGIIYFIFAVSVFGCIPLFKTPIEGLLVCSPFAVFAVIGGIACVYASGIPQDRRPKEG